MKKKLSFLKNPFSKKVKQGKKTHGWYISTIGNLVYQNGEDALMGVSCSPFLMWYDYLISQKDFQRNDLWKKANNEIDTFPILKQLAINKGFKKGVKIKWTHRNGSFAIGTINNVPYWAVGSDCLVVSVNVNRGISFFPLLFDNVWAEIIE